MTDRRRMQRLVRPHFFAEAVRALACWFRPLSTRRLLRGIDFARFAYLQRRHCDLQRLRRRYGYLDARKYLDVRRFLEVSKRDVQELGLTRSEPPQRILDLGAGAGYFGYICRQLGHDCVNLDSDAEPVFGQILEVLGLDRVVHRIEPFKPLPNFGEGFDLITGLAVGFHCCDDGGVWGADEWDDFLRRAKGLLKPGGRLHFRLNADHQRTYFDAQVTACFLRHGFRISGSRMDLKVPAKRPATANVARHTVDGSGLAVPHG